MGKAIWDAASPSAMCGHLWHGLWAGALCQQAATASGGLLCPDSTSDSGQKRPGVLGSRAPLFILTSFWKTALYSQTPVHGSLTCLQRCSLLNINLLFIYALAVQLSGEGRKGSDMSQLLLFAGRMIRKDAIQVTQSQPQNKQQMDSKI